MIQILTIDEDKNIRRYLCAVFTHAGYRSYSADSAEEALALMETTRIDLIVIDPALSRTDGYSFTRLLRDCHHTLPILMLSSRHQIEDIKKGFLAGTDDYLGKPFDEEELLLRIHALLRRARLVSEHRLRYGSTELNYDTLTVRVGDETTVLPQKEFYLLYKLLSYPDQIFSRNQLMEEIWGPSSNSLEATVSVHINRLRKRFDSCPDFSIVTIHGIGYKAKITQSTPVIPRLQS